LSSYIWTDENIRWMQDAAKKSRYYPTIAEKIAAYLPPSARVFDAGGGLGDLAMWLSYHVRHVTVIEQDPKAVAAFRTRCPKNVSTMMGDVFTYIPDALYDALVLCFFGKPGEVLPLAKELSRGKTFVVQSAESEKAFSLNPQEAHGITIHDIANELKEQNISYSLELFEVEHGQPFASLEDACAFFSFYSRRECSAEEVEPLLSKTNDPALPLYFAKTRKLGLLIFEAGAKKN